MMAGRRRWVVAGLVVALAAGGGYYAWRPRPPAPPAIDLGALDAEVAQAVRAAQDGVEADPASADAWGELGLVLFAHALYSESRACFAEAEGRAPTDYRWPYFHALSYLPADPERALPGLDRAVERCGPEVGPRVRRAEVLLALERVEEARAAFDEVQRRPPGHPRAALGLGQLAARDGDWDRATELLTPLTSDPNCRYAALATLATAAARRGDADAARRHQAALEDLPKDEIWSDPALEAMYRRQVGVQGRLRRAVILTNRGDHAGAEVQLQAVVRADPQSAAAYLGFGRLYLAKGDHARAEPALERAVALDPRAAVPQFLLGSARLGRNNLAGAEAAFRAAVALQPDYAPAHYYLGQCRQRQNDLPGAIAAYRQAVRYRPNLAEVHVALGAALLDAGEPAAARGHLRDALRLKPEDAEAARLLKRAGG